MAALALGSSAAFAQLAVSTLAGSGSAGSANGNGTAASFQFSTPSAAAVDASGNVYVADPGNHVIRKIASNGDVTTFAGTAGSPGSADGTGANARFTSPRGITIDGAGNLFVADSGNNIIRMITTPGAVVTTIAGTAGTTGSTDATGAAARFNSPFGIAADRASAGSAANVYVADSQNHTIRQIVVSSGVVTTLAGSPGLSGFVNGAGATARFNQPVGIVSNNAGTTLYVTDRFNHAIRQIAISAGTGTVSTLAGSGVPGQTDSSGASASFDNPTGIAFDSGGNLVVCDTFNHTIRGVTTGGVVTTIAGLADTSGNTNGLATVARFNFPSGVAVDASGNMYVVDTNNQLVRKISAATAPSINTQPTAQSTTAGGSATFTVSASGNPPVSYQWQIQPGGVGGFSNITNGGNYSGATTASLTVSSVTAAMNGDRFQVVVSNGVGSPATSSAAALTVTQPPVFTSATSANFVAGTTTQFQVTVTGTPTPTLSVTGLPSSGWLSFNTATGVLTGAPTGGEANATITFTASNTAGTVQQTFTANVVSTTVPQITGPSNQSVASGGTTASFSVSVTGTPNNFTYQWERSTSGTGGPFTALANGLSDGVTYSGVNTPTLTLTGITPSLNGYAYRVVVNSGGGTTTSTPALLNVAPIITSQPSFTFVNNQSGTFNFEALGTPTPTISINVSGVLPDGITFNSPTLSGTPSSTASSTTFIQVIATNSGGTATQNFQLNVTAPQPPAITSAFSTTFNLGQPGSFTFTASGAPTPTILLFGNLPSGVTYNQQTGILSGTPQTVDGSPFILTVQATNSSGTTTPQNFTLTVLGVAPTITSHPASVTVNVGQAAVFTGSATGTPTPTLRWQRQPAGTTGFINLTDDGVYSGTSSNTLTINAVTPSMGLDQYRLVASNGTQPDAVSNSAELRINLGTVITTIAGQAGFVGTVNGIGANARFNTPSSIAADPFGNLYIADTANHLIRKMTGTTVTTLAGVAGFSGSNDGSTAEARFNSPQGVAVDGAGNVYVADTFNHVIRVISPVGTVTTRAGTPGAPGSSDGVGAAARFFAPTALAVDLSGTLYVADTSNHTIRRVATDGTVTTIAGSAGSPGFLDGVGAGARFNTPAGIAVDSFGTLYVADSFNQVIRKITSGATVTTFVGLAGNAGFSDGIGSAARFNRPSGVALDTSGNVYVADTINDTIRKVTTGGEVTTLAGQPTISGSADGSGSTARFNQPVGVAVDYAGNLYIADTRNHTIRRSGAAAAPQFQTQPTSRAAAIGQSTSFTALATGSPQPGYQWLRATPTSFGVFVPLTNTGVYSGVTTGTLTINTVTADMNGDQFRVVANNGVAPITSDTVTLTAGIAPTITSPATAEFRAGIANRFVVTATSDTAVTFGATNLPSWATINPSTGEITGTPPDTSGSPFTVTVTAANPAVATQTLVITVIPAVLPPTVTTQPSNVSVELGQPAVLSVTVSGTEPFTYQWRRDGVAIPGATTSTLVIPSTQASNAGTYAVAITNSVGSALSNTVTLVVNAPPALSLQPRTQIATAGSAVTFSVATVGGSPVNYQWRRNGVPISGANSPTFTIVSAGAADVGSYDVVVSNAFGAVNSSVAQLTLVSGPTAPIVTAQPAPRTVLTGSSVTLSVGATGAPAPTYQWRRNGGAIPGATSATLTINSAQQADAGVYDVVVTNASGSVISAGGLLRVIARSYAGVYFGSFQTGLGEYALYVREDNTGVFLGYMPGVAAPVMSLNMTVSDAGQFSFSQGAIAASAQSSDVEPPRAAALGQVSVVGTVQADGTIVGTVSGGTNASLTGSRAANTGPTQNLAGYYQAGSAVNGAAAYTIVGANGLAFIVAQSAGSSDGGRGTAVATGQVSVSTGRTNISETITPTNGTLSGGSSGAVNAVFTGGSEVALSRQRLVNISSRARVGTGDAVAIAGFVISGQDSKPVLIRAVGPTIGAAPFNVAGALASPRLEVYRGSSLIESNAGIAGNRATIDAASAQAGAFPLGASGADAAILTTLAPGAYTAVVSSATNTAGVALVEVYDLSGTAPGQKLLNIATRASASTAENTLIAGFVIPAGASKRVLVRGVGPGLIPFGVSGTLAQPALALLNGSTTIAQNTNWTTSADRLDITAASAQVGAFGLANNDSALIVTLAPGNYTAQVLGVGGTTGVALIEVYELP